MSLDGLQTIERVLYNATVTKIYKRFLATYRPVGGVVRAVLVKEKHGWFAFFSTDPNASVAEILEAFATKDHPVGQRGHGPGKLT